MATAAGALIAALDRMPLADMTQELRAIGVELNQTMGGSSGVPRAIFFAAAGDATAGMLRARAGRSAKPSPDKPAGVNDPGAAGVARLIEGLAPGAAWPPQRVGVQLPASASASSACSSQAPQAAASLARLASAAAMSPSRMNNSP